MFAFFTYSLGLFLGIQIGKEQNPNYKYYVNNQNRSNTDYYKNYQLDFRYNK